MWRFEILGLMLKHKWADRDYRYSQLFYRLKIAICILLDIEAPPAIEAYDLSTYHVRVCYIAGGIAPGTDNSPTVYWSDALVVGHGLFKNWWYTEHQESSD